MNYRIKKIVRFLLKDGVLSRIYRQASILKAKYKMGISDEKFLRQKFLENTGEILDLDNEKSTTLYELDNNKEKQNKIMELYTNNFYSAPIYTLS